MQYYPFLAQPAAGMPLFGLSAVQPTVRPGRLRIAAYEPPWWAGAPAPEWEISREFT